MHWGIKTISSNVPPLKILIQDKLNLLVTTILTRRKNSEFIKDSLFLLPLKTFTNTNLIAWMPHSHPHNAHIQMFFFVCHIKRFVWKCLTRKYVWDDFLSQNESYCLLCTQRVETRFAMKTIKVSPIVLLQFQFFCFFSNSTQCTMKKTFKKSFMPAQQI